MLEVNGQPIQLVKKQGIPNPISIILSGELSGLLAAVPLSAPVILQIGEESIQLRLEDIVGPDYKLQVNIANSITNVSKIQTNIDNTIVNLIKAQANIDGTIVTLWIGE